MVAVIVVIAAPNVAVEPVADVSVVLPFAFVPAGADELRPRRTDWLPHRALGAVVAEDPHHPLRRRRCVYGGHALSVRPPAHRQSQAAPWRCWNVGGSASGASPARCSPAAASPAARARNRSLAVQRCRRNHAGGGLPQGSRQAGTWSRRSRYGASLSVLDTMRSNLSAIGLRSGASCPPDRAGEVRGRHLLLNTGGVPRTARNPATSTGHATGWVRQSPRRCARSP